MDNTKPASPESFAARGGAWVIAQFALLLLILIAGPAFGIGWAKTSSACRWTGILFIAAGAWFGLAGVRDLGGNRTPFPRPLADGYLVQTGIYRWVRHPLYAALIWLGFGWSLIFGSMTGAAIAIVQAVFLDAKARREERWLGEKFGGYAAWSKEVKRFIPGVY